jgi:16S rRNA (cytidine1402-2'-O)-methyltransferase
LNIDLPELLIRAANCAAGSQQYPAGTLYVVATPIGNLADMTLRAIHVLGLVDAVACEDTRITGSLLRHLGLTKPLLAVHAHNEQAQAQSVLRRLASGERVAYASDAGTPALSDPGAALVAAAAGAGHRVVPVPGACSAVAALSVAGSTGGAGFAFTGFVPTKSRERVECLQRSAADARVQILFEAPHRIEALAASLAELSPGRELTLCRELTKQFETVVTLPAAALPAWLAADANRTRGEFVVVLHAQLQPDGAQADLDAAAQRMLVILLRELPLKQAVSLTAELSGTARNRVYRHALALRDVN